MNLKTMKPARRAVIIATVLAVAMAALPGSQALTPPFEESTPEEVDTGQICDPVGVVCIGPVVVPVPVFVGVGSDGLNASVEPGAEETEPVGPFYHNFTVAGITVPVVFCPNTCDVPVGPSYEGNGTAWVVVTTEEITCGLVVNGNGTVMANACSLVDVLFPPCSEAESGMPCQEDSERTTLRSMLGLPGNPIKVPLPTGGAIWI